MNRLVRIYNQAQKIFEDALSKLQEEFLAAGRDDENGIYTMDPSDAVWKRHSAAEARLYYVEDTIALLSITLAQPNVGNRLATTVADLETRLAAGDATGCYAIVTAHGFLAPENSKIARSERKSMRDGILVSLVENLVEIQQ